MNLPFALVGGVAAVYLGGGVLDVGSLIGFVTLFGITTRNGIMMVSHWQHLHEVEGMPWGPELVFRGARERLAPVLMTALVTGLGLLPIALGSGEAGREIEGPMALVILGGLVTSTALNLFVLPVLYRRFGARHNRAAGFAQKQRCEDRQFISRQDSRDLAGVGAPVLNSNMTLVVAKLLPPICPSTPGASCI